MGLFNTHICKNCFKSYEGKPEVCPHCGAPIEYKQKKKKEKPEQPAEEQNLDAEQLAQPIEAKPKKQKRHRLSDKEIMDTIDFDALLAKTNDKDVKSWREKKKQEKERIDVTKDEDGYNVDVKDVSYLPGTYTYSAKKARGEYQKPKIAWWEVYKWADLLLARRKVKKQVNRASHYRPSQFSLGATITLCILFGWMGAHNFYVRNWRKGLFTLFCAVLGSVVALHPFFAPVKISIGGGLLFVSTFIWILDLINLCLHQFPYRLSKWKFIDCLNTDTRAKLGFKYVDKDEYKRLWIVRVFHSIKRSSQERKERRLQKEQENKQADEQTNSQEQTEETKVTNIAEYTAQKEQSAKQPQKNGKNVKKSHKSKNNNKNKKK